MTSFSLEALNILDKKPCTGCEWRVRVYRYTSLDGPAEDRPLECFIDVSIDEVGEALAGQDLVGTHGSIECSCHEPSKTLREIMHGKPHVGRTN